MFDVPIDFLQFVQSCSNGSDKPVLLAHNARRFDVPVSYHAQHQHHMVSEFSSHIAGFVDSLLLSKQLNPRFQLHAADTGEIPKQGI